MDKRKWCALFVKRQLLKALHLEKHISFLGWGWGVVQSRDTVSVLSVSVFGTELCLYTGEIMWL